MATISKIYGSLLAILLSALGFSTIVSSCAKYGVLVCRGDETFKPQITGSVVSENNNTPIEGIRAVLKAGNQGLDTTYTATNGDFLLQHPHSICKEELRFLLVELRDVDGDGVFEDKEISIDAQSQSLGTIQMTPKE